MPSHFKEDSITVLQETIENSGLATLVTFGAGGLDASHVPMLLDRHAGPPLGTLYGHIARPNPQWRGGGADEEHLLAVVTKLTEAHEAGRKHPWAVTDAPADFIRAHLKGIIGFELPVERLEGKWKMSQNRPEEDRAGVVAGLEHEGAADVAALVSRARK